MFRLIKWTALGVAVVGAGGYFLFGEHVPSYVRTAATDLRASVRGKIPVEFELRRAEKLVQQIAPEIHECKRDLARAEVELEGLVGDVSRLRKKISRQQRKLKSGCEILDSAKAASYRHDDTVYSRRRIELDLERTFESFKNNKGLLQGKQLLIERQTQAVATARAKLDAVRAEKARLENTIATLKTQQKHLQVMAASSRRFDLDDTALSRAKEVLAKVKKRLDVAQKMIQDDIFFTDGIDLSGKRPSNRDIVREISTHFAGLDDSQPRIEPAGAALSPRDTRPARDPQPSGVR